MSTSHSSLTEVARAEIEALHRFFVTWFGGRLPESDCRFETDFASRLDKDFILIQPGGETLRRDDLLQAIRSGYGSNPDFRIAIRAVSLRRTFATHLLATYEEWQRNAKASSPSDNARLATVLFLIDDSKLRWLHVHETWLPPGIMAAGPYDF